MVTDKKLENSKIQFILDFIIKMNEFLLVLLIIYDCNTIYRASTDIEINQKKWIMLGVLSVTFLLIILHVLKDRSNLQCIKDQITLFILSALFFLEFNAINSITIVQQNFNVSNEIIGGYFLASFILFLNLLIILIKIYKKKQDGFRLLYLMEHMVLFLAATSFVLWIGAALMELWGRGSDITVLWGGELTYANHLNLFVRRWWFRGDMYKNLGIFVEPPMFGLVLGIALYTELFLKKKINLLNVFVLMLGILSCQAVLGVMLSLGAFVLLFMEMIHKKKHAKIIISILLISAFFAGIGLLLYKQHTGWGSFATHIDDFVAAFKCWKEYPVFGCGYDNPGPIIVYMSEFRANNLGLSNSGGVVLAEGGILLFAVYVIPFLLLMLAFFKNNRRLAYWSLGMLGFWIVVIFHTRMMIFLLMAYGYAVLNLKFHLHPKENSKRLEVSLDFYEENKSETSANFSKKILSLPEGFVFVLGFALLFTAVYELLHAGDFAMRGNIVAGLVILAEIIIIIRSFGFRKYERSKFCITQLMLWLIMILAGQPYHSLNMFITNTGMRIQDTWWISIAIYIGIYGTILVIEEIMKHIKLKIAS